MIFANRMRLTFGKDYLGPAILVEGPLELRVLTLSDVWKLDGSSDDARKCWRLSCGTSITRTSNKCPDQFLNVFNDEINKLPATEIHPALVNGLESETFRLMPHISTDTNTRFQEFLAILDSEFDFNINSCKNKNMVPFVDGMGPNLMTIVDDKPAILPEIPPVYLAPEEWRVSMWRISNYMIGPICMGGLEDNEQIQFDGLRIAPGELTLELKGLFYFHMAISILIFDANVSGSPHAPYLSEFLRLFSKGIRFLDQLT